MSCPEKGVVQAWVKKMPSTKDIDSVPEIQRTYGSYRPEGGMPSYERCLHEVNGADETFTTRDITMNTDEGKVLSNVGLTEKGVGIPAGLWTGSVYNRPSVPQKKPET